MSASRHAAFDTLTYARKLEEAGFTPHQAEVQAHALADIVDERLATKEDIGRLEGAIETLRIATEKDIKEMEKRIDLKLEALRMGVKKDMEAMRLSLIIWLGSTVVASMVAGVGLIAVLSKL